MLWYSCEKNSKFELIHLDDIFKMSKGTLASEKAEEGEFKFVTASDEIKSSNYYDNDGEALVMAVSAGGSLGKTHYINDKFIASNLCVVLKDKHNVKYPINLKFYDYYFKTIRENLVDDLADGTSKLTIDSDSLLYNYLIEYVPKDVQDKFVKENLEPFENLQQQIIEKENAVKSVIKNIIK